MHEDLELHLKDLVFRELILADIDEILQQRWINFLVLGSDKHRSDCNKLNLAIAYLSASKVPIDDVTRDEERLRQQLEVVLNLDEPVNESRADRLVYLGLTVHIQIIDRPIIFLGEHVLEDVAAELANVEYRVECVAIAARQLTEDLAVAPLVEHLLLLLDRYLLQLCLLLGRRLQSG